MAHKYDPLLESKLNDAVAKHLIEWPSNIDPRSIKPEKIAPNSKTELAYKSFERDKDAFKYELYEKFKELILTWGAMRKTQIPAQFFQLGLKGFITELFRSKEHSTTARDVQCDPSNLDDWYYCRHRSSKAHDFESSECEHRIKGFCQHSEAKRKRMDEVYSEMGSISTEGSILSEVVTEDGSEEKEYYHDDLISSGNDFDIKDLFDHLNLGATDQKILQSMAIPEDLNYSELGRAVGMSDNAVRKRIEKIREKIISQYPELLEGLGISYN